MTSVKPIKPLIQSFHSSATDVPMIARLVRPNEGRGRFDPVDNSYCKKNDSKELLVEFYDARHPTNGDPISGQFIASYYLSTLLDRSSGSGLNLDGGVPDWQVDGKSMDDVMTWADAQRQRLSLPRDPDPLTFD